MISLRRGDARHHDPRLRCKVWRAFAPMADGFGALEALDEHRLPPRAELPRYPHDEAEVITYVREGSVAYEDSIGHTGVIHAGEFQRLIAALGARAREANASRANWAHVFQIRLRRSTAELEPGREQRRFSAAERRDGLCIVASQDARRGSLRLHQDARMYAALLEPGQHVVHELAPDRAAWLHVVQGEVTLGDLVLTAGDGAAVTTERSVSLTARDGSEILLLDVVERQAHGP